MFKRRCHPWRVRYLARDAKQCIRIPRKHIHTHSVPESFQVTPSFLTPSGIETRRQHTEQRNPSSSRIAVGSHRSALPVFDTLPMPNRGVVVLARSDWAGDMPEHDVS